MSTHLIQSETLANIANAIRAKDGSSGTMTPTQMPTKIANIPSGGGTPTFSSFSSSEDFYFSGDSMESVSVAIPTDMLSKTFVAACILGGYVSARGVSFDVHAERSSNSYITVDVTNSSSLATTMSFDFVFYFYS